MPRVFGREIKVYNELNEAITKIIYELLALTISMPNVLIVSLKCDSVDI